MVHIISPPVLHVWVCREICRCRDVCGVAHGACICASHIYASQATVQDGEIRRT